MKATLEFNLDELDDEVSHKQCVMAQSMALAIWEFTSNSKRSLEAEIEEKNIDGYETLDLVFQRFRDILDEYHINIDELVI